MRDNKVQSVSRAIELITYTTEQPGGITIGQLAERSNLHKSTVSRLIMTLEYEKVIHRSDPRGAIKINPEFARRFIRLNEPVNLKTIARPFLEEMSRHFG